MTKRKAGNVLVTSRHLYHSGRYSDLTVKCGEDTYRCHKATLCPQSKFFEACCTPGFKEADDSTIELRDDEAAAVKRMIQYFYTSDYDKDADSDKGKSKIKWIDDDKTYMVPPSEKEKSKDDNSDHEDDCAASVTSDGEEYFKLRLPTNLAVYVIAEKYGIEGLRKLAHTRTMKCLSHPQLSYPDDAVQCFEKYLLHYPPEEPLRKDFQNEMLKQYFYVDGEDGKRKLVPVTSSEAFKYLIKSNPEFAFECVDILYKRQESFASVISSASRYFKYTAAGGWSNSSNRQPSPLKGLLYSCVEKRPLRASNIVDGEFENWEVFCGGCAQVLIGLAVFEKD